MTRVCGRQWLRGRARRTARLARHPIDALPPTPALSPSLEEEGATRALSVLLQRGGELLAHRVAQTGWLEDLDVRTVPQDVHRELPGIGERQL
jgi:hypothetical protein